MRTYFLICSIVISFLGLAQIPSFKHFIPKGFTLLDSASGDLNKDGIKDLLLILKNNTEVEMSDTTRPLFILHGTKNNTYTLVARNDHAVLCQACGGVFGDPYDDLVIKNNFFSIEHYGGSNWRWTRIITFKYDLITKQYVLHRDASVSYHTSDPDKTTESAYRKKEYDILPFTKYNYNDE